MLTPEGMQQGDQSIGIQQGKVLFITVNYCTKPSSPRFFRRGIQPVVLIHLHRTEHVIQKNTQSGSEHRKGLRLVTGPCASGQIVPGEHGEEFPLVNHHPHDSSGSTWKGSHLNS